MQINSNLCVGCHTCQGVCPMMAIAIKNDGKCEIDPSKCVNCGTCASMCPVSAIGH